MNKKSPIWHPFTQHAIAPDSINIESAQGVYLHARDDNGTPRKIIDAISSWWVITHGHCHPSMISAVQEQAQNLEQVIFAGFTHAPAEQLAENLLKRSQMHMPYDAPHEHIFFADSGSTSVEAALKMAIGYWEHTGMPRHKILSLDGGYHGDTFGAMSTGTRCVYNKPYEPFLFDTSHIPPPTASNESKSFEALETYLKAHGNETAAFIFEPLILGASGMQFYDPENLKTLADMCRKYGVLLIADEVMTGFGRTGTFFACEQAQITPDIMCLSKGITAGFLPMGATLCTRAIYDAFYDKDRTKTFFHSSSFSGNPLACAAANASLEIWDNEPVQERINAITAAHKKAAQSFTRHDTIEDIRVNGIILAMDVITENTGYLAEIQPFLYDSFLSQNVLLRPLGNTVYILPPYCITQEELDNIYDSIHITLGRLGHEGKQRAIY